ncbi:MAG: hypothetical protein ACM3TT_12835 [Syntrophothermus sp.]
MDKCPYCGSEEISRNIELHIVGHSSFVFRPLSLRTKGVLTPNIDLVADVCKECGHVGLRVASVEQAKNAAFLTKE